MTDYYKQKWVKSLAKETREKIQLLLKLSSSRLMRRKLKSPYINTFWDCVVFLGTILSTVGVVT